MINGIIFDWLLVVEGKRAIVKSNLQAETLETPSDTNQNPFYKTSFVFANRCRQPNYTEFKWP